MPDANSSAGPRLLGPAEVRSLADELDIRPTKQKGQNFVIDANTCRRIVRESGIGPDDIVLEIGPGLGSLTLALLETARQVVAVEIADNLAPPLPPTIPPYPPQPAPSVHLLHTHPLRIDTPPNPHPPPPVP